MGFPRRDATGSCAGDDRHWRWAIIRGSTRAAGAMTASDAGRRQIPPAEPNSRSSSVDMWSSSTRQSVTCIREGPFASASERAHEEVARYIPCNRIGPVRGPSDRPQQQKGAGQLTAIDERLVQQPGWDFTDLRAES